MKYFSMPAAAATCLGLLICGCKSAKQVEAPTTLPAVAAMQQKPLYQMSEKEAGAYITAAQSSEPDLHKRIVAIARKNIGQPYKIYLLGEAPFEHIDDEPIYCLHHSDCLVFAEHTLAMSLTDSWPNFLTMLQRIRYDRGQISVLTRNHYTEADWNKNNSWLASDLTPGWASVGVVSYKETIDRTKFFKSRYKLDATIPVQEFEDVYLPYENVPQIKNQLRDGDIVNFVRGTSASDAYVGHVGLVALGENGEVHLIHSSEPAVREETIEAYIARATAKNAENDAAGKARLRGFKFLRVHDDAWARLREMDGKNAPVVSVPKGSSISFADYAKHFSLGG